MNKNIPSIEDYISNKNGIKDNILKKWEAIGFLSSIKDKNKEIMSYIFEDAVILLSSNSAKINEVSFFIEKCCPLISYDIIVFPILLKVNKQIDLTYHNYIGLKELSERIMNNKEEIKSFSEKIKCNDKNNDIYLDNTAIFINKICDIISQI